MSTDIRLHANSSVALLVAGAVAATPIVMLPVHQAAPVLSTVAVRPASAITDALNTFGDLVDYGFNAVSAPIVAINNAPAFGIAAGAVALTSLALVMLAPLIYGVVFARRNGPAHRAEALLRAVAEIIAALRRPPR